MALKTKKDFRRLRIKHRIRKIVSGTPERPRLTVFRSTKDIYVQLIDDLDGKTIISASSVEKEIASQKGTKSDKAKMVGKLIAEKAPRQGLIRLFLTETVIYIMAG